MTWKSLSPPRGLQPYPSCLAQCPSKTSKEMEIYPAPSCSPTFNDALTSRTLLLLFILYAIGKKNQLYPINFPVNFLISTFNSICSIHTNGNNFQHLKPISTLAPPVTSELLNFISPPCFLATILAENSPMP